VITYRTFKNSDPPRLLQLWGKSDLGRGAALGFSCDALDMFVLSQPFFDPRGIILAFEGELPVGFIHAGFGANATGTGLDHTVGVICAVMVRPEYRRQGIGTELVRQAEVYLQSRGTSRFFAGESGTHNPFYLGLYGGSESVGFLESDPLAALFFQKLGYLPMEQHLLFRRDISQANDPFDPRFLQIRRKAQLAIIDRPLDSTWWWMTRMGRFDSISFVLVPTGSNDILAQVTCWGMDLQSAGWRQRTVGLHGLFVPEKERKKAYAKTLLVEVMRRMREEMVTHVDLSARADDLAGVALCRKLGFEQIDTGVVYGKTPPP